MLPSLILGLLAVSPVEQRYTFTEAHMGTKFALVLYAADEGKAKEAVRAAFARIAQLDDIMSDYKSTSELMRLCKGNEGKPTQVSEDLFAVLQEAQRFAKLTDGAFDVSIAPVVRLWRRARRSGKLPDEEELRAALAKVDYRKIALDPKMRTVHLQLLGMLLDLGGIAKGYAADAALEVLGKHGITRALVAAGGDIVVGDAPPGKKGWRIGIAPLKNPEAAPTLHVLLENAAVSTSGDSQQAVEIGGKRYSHIVDPKTGLGLIGRRSVTIIARRGTTTDPLATAACILGVEKGLRLVESMEGVAGLFVFETERGEKTVRSKRFAGYEVRD